MTYFKDLTQYEYFAGDENTLNIGWLSKEHEFTRGPVSLAFAHEMQLLTENIEKITRGHHVCEFCDPPNEVISIEPSYREVWEMFRSGNGEIRVKGNTGIVYCAPALIVHYVAEHQYQPPKEFIDAVLLHREDRWKKKNA